METAARQGSQESVLPLVGAVKRSASRMRRCSIPMSTCRRGRCC